MGLSYSVLYLTLSHGRENRQFADTGKRNSLSRQNRTQASTMRIQASTAQPVSVDVAVLTKRVREVGRTVKEGTRGAGLIGPADIIQRRGHGLLEARRAGGGALDADLARWLERQEVAAQAAKHGPKRDSWFRLVAGHSVHMYSVHAAQCPRGFASLRGTAYALNVPARVFEAMRTRLKSWRPSVSSLPERMLRNSTRRERCVDGGVRGALMLALV